MTARIGVLASGSGSNLQAIVDACGNGTLDARVVVVISNNSRAPALERARDGDIPTLHASARTHPDPDALDAAICDALERYGATLVVTAGYMKKLGPRTLAAWKGRIINIHPSLLPRHGGPGMYGLNVHKAVIDAGDNVTGITIHHVDGDYDTGPVIARKELPVRPDDTPESLAARVLAEEHAFLIETLRDWPGD